MSVAAYLSVIAICSNMAEPVFAFQLPEMDVLLIVKEKQEEMNRAAKRWKANNAPPRTAHLEFAIVSSSVTRTATHGYVTSR